MNTKVVIVKVIAISFALFFLNASVFGHVSKYSELNFDSIGEKPQVELIKTRLNNISGNIDMAYSKEVHERILQYTVKHRHYTEKLLGKAIVYFPIFEEQIRERGLPQELKYVAVVESLLNHNAQSKSGARGLWQFMPATGRQYGLEKTKDIDQRVDPMLSTIAALEYMSDLYDQFDDWTLAMAAYNCGPGNIRRAMRKSGKKDYWSLRSYLPKETQKYIPRIIAASYLINYYHSHNLTPKGYQDIYQQTTVITPAEERSLAQLSESLNVDSELLRQLNPMFQGDKIPVSSAYGLRLPENRLFQYYTVYEPENLSTVFEAKQSHSRQRKLITRDSIEHLEKIVSYYGIQQQNA